MGDFPAQDHLQEKGSFEKQREKKVIRDHRALGGRRGPSGIQGGQAGQVATQKLWVSKRQDREHTEQEET